MMMKKKQLHKKHVALAFNCWHQMYGIDLEPLNVDQLAGTSGPLLEVSETAGLYSANLRMWDVKVHPHSSSLLHSLPLHVFPHPTPSPARCMASLTST